MALNVCLDGDDACGRSATCTMVAVWREGQERMLDVYRQARLSELVPQARAGGELVRLVPQGEPRPPGTP